MEIARKKKAEVEEMTEKQQSKEDEINKRKATIDLQMADVQPILEAAKSAVGNVSFKLYMLICSTHRVFVCCNRSSRPIWATFVVFELRLQSFTTFLKVSWLCWVIQTQLGLVCVVCWATLVFRIMFRVLFTCVSASHASAL